jgi:predicted ATPase
MYVQSLTIRSLRCFDSAEVSLQYPGRDKRSDLHAPNVNLLLGNNGAGKSTTLRAIALAALSPIMSTSGYVPYNMVRRGARDSAVDAEVLFHEQDLHGALTSKSDPGHTAALGVKIEKAGDVEILKPAAAVSEMESGMYDEHSPAFFVVGYGATRRVEDTASFSPNEQRKRRILRYQRVAGLFESQIALTPLAAWLPRLNKGRSVQVVHLINRLLPEGASFSGARERGEDAEYLFRFHGIDVPFGALSDGYRAYIGWIADLLYHVCHGSPTGAKLVENRGLVLVDEIDLHLHPEWQRNVIATVSKALPNLQFVFTTHSPIVAGSLQKENIFVMEVNGDGASEIKQFEERIYGLDAQQVLLSSYFGLESTRAPGFVDEVEEMSRELKPGRSDLALSIMRKLTGGISGNGKAAEGHVAKGVPRRATRKK